MRVLLDTDVLLDVALKREAFLFASQEVLRWAEGEPGQASVAWHTLSNIAYLTVSSREFIRQLLKFVEVAEVGTKEARQAVDLPMSDLEDALQAAAALAFGASFVVSRNVHDYRKSPVPALSPAAFLARLGKPK
jgi:predicted nucleic acid-binding protein